MKNTFNLILAIVVVIMISCNSKTSESEQVNEPSLSENDEVIQYLTPKQKSIHLFNLPEGVSEEQFVNSISEVNSAITEIGYPGVGYHVYKVESDTVLEYRYFMEGLWPDPETYKTIHDNEKWIKAIDKNREMLENVFQEQIYRRLLKVEMLN
jgi:hypothetical protein